MHYLQASVVWLTALLVMAAIPISNGINNLLKRRNLPTLLTVYLTLTITQIVLTTNLNYLHKVNNGKYKIDNLLINQTTNSDSFQFESDVSGSKNVLVYNQTGQSLDGSEKIFVSIIQSPSFLICDTSLLSSILVSLAVLLFSPYMFIFGLEGAAIAYFTSLAPGLDTDSSSRYDLYQHYRIH